MKTLEDFKVMTIPQLTGILNGLDVAVPKGAKKSQLVQLAYDTQQPVNDEEIEEQGGALEENKETNTGETFARDLQAVVDHFKGTAAVEVDETDGVVIFAIMDELADEELARGTFLDLLAQVAPKPNELIDLDKEAGVGANDMSEQPDVEEINTDTPPLADEDNLAIIEAGLKPLRYYGLKYTIDGSVIKLQAGSKVATTTLNQPTHRVIHTAEQLCNR